MTGRATRNRAAPQPEPFAAQSPTRRSTRRTAVEDATAMPPPVSTATSSTKAYPEQARHLAPRRGDPVARNSQASIASVPTHVTQEDDDDDERNDEVVEADYENENNSAERRQDLEINMPERSTRRTVLFSQGRAASNAASELELLNIRGGSSAKARILRRHLGPLRDYAVELRNILAKPRHRQDESWYYEYQDMRDSFLGARRKFGTEAFMTEATVLESLQAPEGDKVWNEASLTIAMSNIVSFLDECYHIRAFPGIASHDVRGFLEGWDMSFPSRFISRGQLDQALWIDHSAEFDLAIEIRTQKTIYTFELDGGDKDTLQLFDAIWLNPQGNSTREHVLAFLKGSDEDSPALLQKDLAGASLQEEQYIHARDKYVARLRQLYASVASRSPASGVEELKSQFPLQTTMDALEQWSQNLFESINKAVKKFQMDSIRAFTPASAVGYAPSSSSQIADSQAGSQVDPRMYAENGINRQPAGIEDDFDLPTYLAMKAAVNNELAQEPSGPSQSDGIPDSSILDNVERIAPRSSYPAPTQFPYSHDSPTPAQQRPGQQFAFAAAATTGAAFASSAAVASSSTARGKRPMDTQDDDESAFETDTRQPRGRRRVEIAETPQRPRKRARTSKTAAAQGTPGTEGSQTPRRVPPVSATEIDLEALSQRARQAGVVTRKQKEPQKRHAWTRNDAKTLIAAVDVYKAKWSLMQAQIEKGVLVFDHPRDQQALRDKARLIKQDYLKADQLLPPSFDLVVLGKKEKLAVEACGKNPDRKEADFDEQTLQPTNTEYVPGGDVPVAHVPEGDVPEGERDGAREEAREGGED